MEDSSLYNHVLWRHFVLGYMAYHLWCWVFCRIYWVLLRNCTTLFVGFGWISCWQLVLICHVFLSWIVDEAFLYYLSNCDSNGCFFSADEDVCFGFRLPKFGDICLCCIWFCCLLLGASRLRTWSSWCLAVWFSHVALSFLWGLADVHIGLCQWLLALYLTVSGYWKFFFLCLLFCLEPILFAGMYCKPASSQ